MAYQEVVAEKITSVAHYTQVTCRAGQCYVSIATSVSGNQAWICDIRLGDMVLSLGRLAGRHMDDVAGLQVYMLTLGGLSPRGSFLDIGRFRRGQQPAQSRR
jgi:hypothetical protein